MTRAGRCGPTRVTRSCACCASYACLIPFLIVAVARRRGRVRVQRAARPPEREAQRRRVTWHPARRRARPPVRAARGRRIRSCSRSRARSARSPTTSNAALARWRDARGRRQPDRAGRCREPTRGSRPPARRDRERVAARVQGRCGGQGRGPEVRRPIVRSRDRLRSTPRSPAIDKQRQGPLASSSLPPRSATRRSRRTHRPAPPST